MVERGSERVRHSYLGTAPFLSCWFAECRCGWSSDLHPSHERALIAYGRHRAWAGASRWLPLRSPVVGESSAEA